MKLYVSLTSPFARKARVAVLEKNLADRVETVVVDPWSSPDELVALNPLSQVPTLVTDEGLAVGDADTIIDLLERRFPEPALMPADEAARAQALAVAALAQGMIESTVAIVIESRKPDGQRGEAIVARRRAAIERCVDALAERFDRDGESFGVDALGVACALGYLDLRLPDFDWRARQPALADWQAKVAARPSMQATAPPAA